MKVISLATLLLLFVAACGTEPETVTSGANTPDEALLSRSVEGPDDNAVAEDSSPAVLTAEDPDLGVTTTSSAAGYSDEVRLFREFSYWFVDDWSAATPMELRRTAKGTVWSSGLKDGPQVFAFDLPCLFEVWQVTWEGSGFAIGNLIEPRRDPPECDSRYAPLAELPVATGQFVTFSALPPTDGQATLMIAAGDEWWMQIREGERPG